MPHPCVVCGRSRMNPNNREEEYMFFGFPVNDDIRCRSWLEFCGREDLYKLTKKQLLQRMVCSKHFEKKDFLNDYYDRLNCGAIPSVYDPKQSLYNITCVLCGRFRKDPPEDYDGTTFHHFPGEEFRCLEWLDFVGVDSYYRLTRKEILFCYICSKHFDRSQFMQGYKNRLEDYAVPNIRFPEEGGEDEPFILELISEPKLCNTSEKLKKMDPLPTAVLGSQACAACGRSRLDPRNKAEKYKFHPFPAYEIGRCLRWCQFLGREDILKMSPNQIRKLVLCSKHFQTGQNFHNVGPCDAVPTIRDIQELTPEEVLEQMEMEQEELEEMNRTGKRVSRPLVSSKKPKVDNKPAPLAKKRGKSRRPTSINIPKPESLNLDSRPFIRKLPIPAATNWKFQFSNQFQPISIGNNIAPNLSSNIPSDLKKMILPFTGDISNLGAPIPVHSLSSMPPGLLIKINLPDQGNNVTKSGRGRGRSRGRGRGRKLPGESRQRRINNGCIPKTLNVITEKMEPMEKMEHEVEGDLEYDDHSAHMSELLSLSTEEVVEEFIENDMQLHEEVILPDMESYEGHEVQIKKEFFLENEEDVKLKSPKRKRLTTRTRRTILPIRNELHHFLRKLKPQLHRLPKNARAKVKLAIVNKMVHLKQGLHFEEKLRHESSLPRCFIFTTPSEKPRCIGSTRALSM